MFRQRSINSVVDSSVISPIINNDLSTSELMQSRTINNQVNTTHMKTKKNIRGDPLFYRIIFMIVCCFLACTQLLKTYDFVIFRIPTTTPAARIIESDGTIVESASSLSTRTNDTHIDPKVVVRKPKRPKTKIASPKTSSSKSKDNYAIPKGMLEWEPSSTTTSKLTRTICTTSALTYPAPTLKSMFAKN